MASQDKAPEISNLTLEGLRIKYINSLSASKNKSEIDAHLTKLTRWLDLTGERLAADVTASDIGDFASEHYRRTALPDHRLLRAAKDFLSYAHRKGHTPINLATSIKLSRVSHSPKKTRARFRRQEVIELTSEGHKALLEQREVLEKEQVKVIEEIERAAADGDARENAPLDAAREEHARISSKLNEIEETLRHARVIDADGGGAADVVRIGSKVQLTGPTSDQPFEFQIVVPREADPLKDKISTESPVGMALMGKAKGDEVEVVTPRGEVRYRINKLL